MTRKNLANDRTNRTNRTDRTDRTILVVGSLAYDRILDFKGRFQDHIVPEKIHTLNVSFFLDRLEERFGGTAGNIAYTLSLLGETPFIISATGKDFEPYRRWLLSQGISLGGIREDRHSLTASAHIITDLSLNQITGFHPGALKYSAWPSGTTWRRWKKEIGLAIIAPGNPEDMMRAVQVCKKDKVRYIFDPGQQVPALKPQELKQAIAGAAVLIGNDYEMHLVRKKTGLLKNNILSKIEVLVTTFGEKGSEIATKEKSYKIPAIKAKKVLDPTGAGDAYRAGLISAVRRGYDWEKAGRVAAIVASYPVRHYGTQEHQLGWNDVRREYKKHFREKL